MSVGKGIGKIIELIKSNRYILALSAIALFALAIRIIGIDRVPPGIPTDTLLYFSNARSIAETGRDIYGHLFPLFSSHKGFLLSPVTVYVIASFYKILGFSFIVGYLPNILISTASILVAGLMATYLTGRRRIGIATALLLSVSPWHYHLSRTGFEGIFGFSLVLFGIYCSILALKKPKFYFLAFIFFAIATFSYKAVNVFLILYPVIFGLTLGWKKSNLKQIALFTLSIWLFIALQWFFLFVSLRDTYATGYINNNLGTAAKNVESDRVMSDAPHLIRLIASNVPISLSQIYFTNYISFFSPQYLLLNGDNDLRFSTGGGGQLYFLDLFFIIAGIIWLTKTRKKSLLYFLLSIIFIAPIASLISDQEYAIRTFITIFAFAILGACGVNQLVTLGLSSKFRKLALVLIGILYLFSVLLYLYRYHFLYIHYSREAWGGANKEVFIEGYSRRLNYHHIIFGQSSEFEFLEFMYWNKLPVKSIQESLTAYDNKTLKYDNFIFVRTCNIENNNNPKNTSENGDFLYTRDSCINYIPPIHQYYLPKMLIWKWKSYNSTTINSYGNRNN